MSSKLHPDSKINPSITESNDSGNESIFDLIAQRPLTRRGFLKASVSASAGVAASAMMGTVAFDALTNEAHADSISSSLLGFESVPANIAPMTDKVTVPAGYTARVLVAWGDSLNKEPHWDTVSAMDEATQLHTFGAHVDGMHYFPLSRGTSNQSGLLVTNSEYVDPALCNGITPASSYATTTLTLAMVRAQQAAHGVNIMRLQKIKGEFQINRNSPYNRRITGNTVCRVSGPAAGNALMKTSADSTGRSVLGTLNNCAHGYTPWGTYLACEENFNGYFGSSTALTQSNHEKRYGVSASGFGYRWHTADTRFDVNINRNEPNRFGWVVEIDPFDLESVPVKRTALGRFKHESAMVVVDAANNVAVYMGDDERNEYVYKFVCGSKYNRYNHKANRSLLDSGTLYVAKFNADGSGTWMALVHGQNGLTAENGFADQGEVVIKCRQAADRVGATMMDRPEWVAVHPNRPQCYLTLTNNSRRGDTTASSNNVDGSTSAGSAKPPVDAANPRPDNDYGHIIRWTDAGENVTSTTFQWDIFVKCGDPVITKNLGGTYNTTGHDGYDGNINGDIYGAPDGLWFDKDGRLWIQTDQNGNATGDWVNIGGNSMLCADPATGETRRFLTAPPYAEVTGVITTPDGKTMFVGIQHPGEDWVNTYTENSTWPDNGSNGPTTFTGRSASRPRSAVVVITKDDGGVIGSGSTAV